eukprot:CAMPEP_0198295178 /NCGR_PEP_ID=MMETSP1449-20131203/26341_1 /TAXON_ID=420275 /ORGANISM="Attheya septentrionalis, Strain CCMP2084" /LENGTH=494 /DNA_ID=CAMNT_0043995393 /DNA_START=6 /DNA_END=1487 /DNA_ORIENTATION=+
MTTESNAMAASTKMYISWVLFTLSAAVSVYGMKQAGSPRSRSQQQSQQSQQSALQKALREGTSRDAGERVCTVDEHNRPTAEGHVRSEVRLQNLWHRATYIIVRHVTEEDAANPIRPEHEHILVQRRSMSKDYCPGKLDPAPGGVVGFGESYQLNAEHELAEEMGISSSNNDNTMKRLFTFPYQDERVQCWGELYEVTYRGPLDALTIQEEEVEEVMRMSLSDIQKVTQQTPDAWTPDGRHALTLYLQHRHDRIVKRRLLSGYSSGNLDAYTVRPKPKAIFFDCDDCLYFDGWKTANQLTKKIDEWCVKHGLPEGEAYQLYLRHGTALRGLLAEGHMEHCEDAIDKYLQDVHDLPIHTLLSRDEELRNMIESMDPSIPKYVFTASVSDHADRCLKALGIRDLFADIIIDVKACGLVTKHSKEAFQAAMKIANVDDPESCVFLDDSVNNIRAAREVGWRSILVGRVGRDCGTPISSDDAEHEIDRIHELPTIFPE